MNLWEKVIALSSCLCMKNILVVKRRLYTFLRKASININKPDAMWSKISGGLFRVMMCNGSSAQCVHIIEMPGDEPQRSVTILNCLFVAVRIHVDYVFGLRPHCFLPLGDRKWLCKEQELGFSLYPIWIPQSFLFLTPAPLLPSLPFSLFCSTHPHLSLS